MKKKHKQLIRFLQDDADSLRRAIGSISEKVGKMQVSLEDIKWRMDEVDRWLPPVDESALMQALRGGQ